MTVRQLERSLTMRELYAWADFEADFGPFTIHERVDHAAAQIAYMVHAVAHDKDHQLPPEKFLVKWQRPEPLTDEQIWAWLGALAKEKP